MLAKSRLAIFKSLVPKEEMRMIEYIALVKVVGDHFEPKPSEIVERYKFNTRVQ